MRTYVEELVTVSKVKECCCNKCGQLYQKNNQDLVNVNTEFVDYDTTYENQKWNFDVCAVCLVEWFKTFQIAPTGFMQDYTDVCVVKDQQKTFEKWQQTDEWDEYLGYSYDELVALVNGWTYTIESVNELIQKYYPDRDLISE